MHTSISAKSAKAVIFHLAATFQRARRPEIESGTPLQALEELGGWSSLNLRCSAMFS
jgi:hypothetical protein